jgi:hypothetical protein
MKLNSKRQYQIAILEYGTEGIDMANMTLQEILESNEEFCLSIQGMLDEVLDLEEFQSMYFKPNRDVGQSKGIILRVD